MQLGGFDTHDNQVVIDETTTGLHSDLLKQLSDAICAFQDDLNLLSVNDRVIGMTYSEFGRRIRSNGAYGTDHGTAAPLFLFGSCIENQILGDHPEIDTQVGIDEGVPMQYDFRDIYGTILKDWLGLQENDVFDVLYPDFQALPLFKESCLTVSSTTNNLSQDAEINVYPNPTVDKVQLSYFSKDQQSVVRVFDSAGGFLMSTSVFGSKMSQHQIMIDLSAFKPGSYFIHIRNKEFSKTKKVVKI